MSDLPRDDSDETGPLPSDDTILPQTALSSELRAFRDSLEGQDCTLGELAERIGDRGFGLLLVLLALPAALPVPAVGYATPFGLLMAFLGLQMVAGRTNPWIPKWFREKKLPFKLLDFSVRNARLPLRAVEFLVRPRLGRLARSRVFLGGVGLTIALLALFMSMPIPLTNTAPSFVIFILAAGMLEEDGLVLLGGLLLAPVAIAIGGLAIYFALTLGLGDDKEAIKEQIKALLP
jgi:hypothetical protein